VCVCRWAWSSTTLTLHTYNEYVESVRKSGYNSSIWNEILGSPTLSWAHLLLAIASSTDGSDKCIISSLCTLSKSPKCSHVATRSLNQERTFCRARPFSSLQHNSRILHPPPHKNQSSFQFSYFVRRCKELYYTVVCVCVGMEITLCIKSSLQYVCVGIRRACVIDSFYSWLIWMEIQTYFTTSECRKKNVNLVLWVLLGTTCTN
jgi:hypothetical protein